jgi:hypothetical protein
LVEYVDEMKQKKSELENLMDKYSEINKEMRRTSASALNEVTKIILDPSSIAPMIKLGIVFSNSHCVISI